MKRPIQMKTIGILGGMSNQATVEYYKMINQEVNNRLGHWDIAETLIQGVNFGNIEYFVRNNRWHEAKAYLTKKAIHTQMGGADLLLCVSNTMHKVLDEIANSIDIPFLHIVDPTGEAIVNANLSKVALLGTKATMEADFLKKRYENKFALEIITPTKEEQMVLDNIIFDELVKGKILETSRQKYIEVCQNLKEKGAQGVILGCTEIFLLLRQSDLPKIPMFNTTELHVKAAVQMAFEDKINSLL